MSILVETEKRGNEPEDAVYAAVVGEVFGLLYRIEEKYAVMMEPVQREVEELYRGMLGDMRYACRGSLRVQSEVNAVHGERAAVMAVIARYTQQVEEGNREVEAWLRKVEAGEVTGEELPRDMVRMQMLRVVYEMFSVNALLAGEVFLEDRKRCRMEYRAALVAARRGEGVIALFGGDVSEV